MNVDLIEIYLVATSSFTLLTTAVLFLSYKLKVEMELYMTSVSVFVPYYNEDSKLLLKAYHF